MVFPTPIRRAVNYPTYKSPYGPKYQYQPTVAGHNMKELRTLGFKAGAFGGVALFAVLFYASGIPIVQRDILQKVPFLSDYYVKETHPADNPF